MQEGIALEALSPKVQGPGALARLPTSLVAVLPSATPPAPCRNPQSVSEALFLKEIQFQALPNPVIECRLYVYM